MESVYLCDEIKMVVIVQHIKFLHTSGFVFRYAGNYVISMVGGNYFHLEIWGRELLECHNSIQTKITITVNPQS